jgi:hypothetical protein
LIAGEATSGDRGCLKRQTHGCGPLLNSREATQIQASTDSRRTDFHPASNGGKVTVSKPVESNYPGIGYSNGI